MRSLRLSRAKYLLLLAIAMCWMFAGSGLVAETTKALTTTSPSAAVSNGTDTDEVAAADKELKEAKANAIKRAGSERKVNPAADSKNQERLNLWSPTLVCQLSLGIGIFAIFILVSVTVLLKQEHGSLMPEQILRTFGILVIIFAAVFLVIAGYSDTQITPVIGLLGTIAGYLLGRRPDQPGTGGDRKSTSTESKN